MSDPTIICPNCKTEIKLNESLAAPLIEATKNQFEKKLIQKDEEIIKRKKDLDKNPIEGIDAFSSKENILDILEKYGMKEGEIEVWGSGKPKREFLWSEDMADACVFLMENRNFKDCILAKEEIRNTHINIGTGSDISIEDLAILIKEEVKFNGSFVFNTSKPDGTMQKLTDVSKLNSLGWKHNIAIAEGVEKIYNWYLN